MSTEPKANNGHTNDAPKTLDNRTFGLIFAGIFVVIGAWPLLFNDGFRGWAGIVAAAFTAVALIFPIGLAPLNRAWAMFGQVMHKITNPILMGLVFFVTVVPTGLILKLLGKDPLRRKLDHHAQSYWIKRDADEITKESFDNQF